MPAIPRAPVQLVDRQLILCGLVAEERLSASLRKPAKCPWEVSCVLKDTAHKYGIDVRNARKFGGVEIEHHVERVACDYVARQVEVSPSLNERPGNGTAAPISRTRGPWQALASRNDRSSQDSECSVTFAQRSRHSE